MSANSWNSFKWLYIVNLLERYCSRRKVKLLVGPSLMTLSTSSRSKKYSRISGISNSGFLSFPLSANKYSESQYTEAHDDFVNTFVVIVYLEYPFYINAKRPPEMLARDRTIVKVKLFMILQVPVRKWGFWIDIPRLKQIWLRLTLGCINLNVWSEPRHIRMLITGKLEMSIIIARIVPDALPRFKHVFVP